MSKRLPVLSSREVIRALARIDFVEIPGRGKGSHHYVYRKKPPQGITIPQRKQIGRGLLRKIIKAADLTVEEFLALL